MGIKHLKRIETIMKRNRQVSFTRTELRDALKTDYNSVLEAIEYLEKQKRIVKAEGSRPDLFRYKWNELYLR